MARAVIELTKYIFVQKHWNLLTKVSKVYAGKRMI